MSTAGSPPPDRPSGGEVEHRTYLCTGCPLGCRLEVDAVDGDVVEVRGFSCKRGDAYARQEYTDPRRPLATTVAVRGGRWPRLPVKSAEALPKALLPDVAAYLHTLHLDAPVKLGDVVAHDVLGSGIDVVATRDLPADLDA